MVRLIDVEVLPTPDRCVTGEGGDAQPAEADEGVVLARLERDLARSFESVGPARPFGCEAGPMR
ncbi:hypothetical protein [Acuticoccus sp.]|uniref:hypothetical protein n=1 Tax=Acuticoccus sp. TaxID=1904378 RepID=UPI003B52B885